MKEGGGGRNKEHDARLHVSTAHCLAPVPRREEIIKGREIRERDRGPGSKERRGETGVLPLVDLIFDASLSCSFQLLLLLARLNSIDFSFLSHFTRIHFYVYFARSSLNQFNDLFRNPYSVKLDTISSLSNFYIRLFSRIILYYIHISRVHVLIFRISFLLFLFGLCICSFMYFARSRSYLSNFFFIIIFIWIMQFYVFRVFKFKLC